MNLARSLKSSFITKTIKYGNINGNCTALLTPLRTKSVQTAAGSGVVDDGKKDDAQQDPTAERTTHFGFQQVKESEKDQKVHKVFEEVASSYDLMNDAMSFGIHRLWKDHFIHRMYPMHGIRLLDMAGGTGDIAFRYIRQLQAIRNVLKSHSYVTVSDINQHMLDVGRERARLQGLTEEQLPDISIKWQQANAEQLPFDNDAFTVYTIAFGIRNCTHIDKVLREAYRVLEPGGRFMCMEFSHLTNGIMQYMYDKYSFQVIPPMGQVLAGQWQPYQYLVESIRQFPNQEEFKKMIEDAGFELVYYENLNFGIVSIHSGFKL